MTCKHIVCQKCFMNDLEVKIQKEFIDETSIRCNICGSSINPLSLKNNIPANIFEKLKLRKDNNNNIFEIEEEGEKKYIFNNQKKSKFSIKVKKLFDHIHKIYDQVKYSGQGFIWAFLFICCHCFACPLMYFIMLFGCITNIMNNIGSYILCCLRLCLFSIPFRLFLLVKSNLVWISHNNN